MFGKCVCRLAQSRKLWCSLQVKLVCDEFDERRLQELLDIDTAGNGRLLSVEQACSGSVELVDRGRPPVLQGGPFQGCTYETPRILIARLPAGPK